MATVAELLEIAVRHHQTGNLAEAEPLYRQVLQADPYNVHAVHVQALHLLGIMARQTGRAEAALGFFRQVIALNPAANFPYFNMGMAHMDLAQLPEAAACFRKQLLMNPEHGDSHVNLGIALVRQGKLAEAALSYHEALRINPSNADACNNLGIVLIQQQRSAEAIGWFQRALAVNPASAHGHINLGNALKQAGQLAEAIACYRQALRLDPGQPNAQKSLGLALLKHKKFAEASQMLRQALAASPHDAELCNQLGVALFEQKQLAGAADCFRDALRQGVNRAGLHNNLGLVLLEQKQAADAAECFRRALCLDAGDAATHNNLGNAYRDLGRLDEALECYRQALFLNPHEAETHSNLGNILKEQGLLAEAIDHYRMACKLDPKNQARPSNVLFTMLYHPGYDCPALFAEHQSWEREYARAAVGAASSAEHRNEPAPERRLRIGYVSPDFRDHVLGRNIWPLLRNHDHRQFDITLYAHLPQADALTEQFRKCADHWVDITPLADDQAANKIREDGIDILVDLTLHSGGNRLMIFARKPAPLQVTFAAYPGGTGLGAVDYRLTDSHLDPPGLFDPGFVEKAYHLPHSFWCYDPPSEEPSPGPLPALANGFVTFGCLNNFCKINDGVLELWAQVLRAVPRSRLLLLTNEGSHRRRTVDLLGQHGVEAERMLFAPRLAHEEYLALYRQVDIGLDTAPYNGHTTSLDAYWMGVPVITLVGKTPVGRGGISQLANLGLSELVAATPEDFVRIAESLAHDLPRLQSLHAGLRERMRRSPLMNAEGFARGIEDAYRSMWRRWCAEMRK